MPERIRENREPYYAALREADKSWDDGQYDVSALSSYLSDLLVGQLTDPD